MPSIVLFAGFRFFGEAEVSTGAAAGSCAGAEAGDSTGSPRCCAIPIIVRLAFFLEEGAAVGATAGVATGAVGIAALVSARAGSGGAAGVIIPIIVR